MCSCWHSCEMFFFCTIMKYLVKNWSAKCLGSPSRLPILLDFFPLESPLLYTRLLPLLLLVNFILQTATIYAFWHLQISHKETATISGRWYRTTSKPRENFPWRAACISVLFSMCHLLPQVFFFFFFAIWLSSEVEVEYL